MVISFLITIHAIIATFVVANSVTKLIERLKDVADKVNVGDSSKSLKSLVTMRSANWHNLPEDDQCVQNESGYE